MGKKLLKKNRDYTLPDNHLIYRLPTGWWRSSSITREIWRVEKSQGAKIVVMTKRIEAKLAELPTTPGVYFHKSTEGEILYIGKAANLRNRVRQYFQKSHLRDPKTDALIAEIKDIDWTELENEADALFLEAELVKRYQPRYNILLRDDKSSQYVRIDYKSDYPTVGLIRRPMDDGAYYFGPYLNSFALKRALRYLRRAFPYAISRPTGQKRASLHYHLGLDPGLEDGRTSLIDYRANLRKLMQYLKGERKALIRNIESEMKKAAAARDFERAAKLRNQLFALKELSRQVLFSDRELLDASKDQALMELTNLFKLDKPPRRIEGFDISHSGGVDTSASMVVFINGVPEKTGYRKFKMRLPGNDDTGHINETLRRRLRDENRQKWGLTDFIIIDGGKGQLSAAIAARDEAGLSQIPMVGLAKRYEEIIVHKASSLTTLDVDKIINQAKKLGGHVTDSGVFLSVWLPPNAHVIKLLQRIRDESHRFATTYHSTLKQKRQTSSLLDDIPGVGPITRKKLIRQFGSLRAITAASEAELQKVLGKQKGASLARYLNIA